MPLRKGTRTRTTPATATATATTPMIDAAIKALMAQGVANALAERTIQKNTSLNGDGSQGSGSGITRPVRPTRECTYSDFLKCQPLKFKGTEGVVGPTQWFKRMESVFHISNYAVENHVNFATCTLHRIALTWWNTHVKTVGHDAAYGMPWKRLMKLITAKYCPRNEIKKLEIEIWNLKVKGTYLASYTQRFEELALICMRMFLDESDKVEKYVSGLPDMIQGSVMAYKPKEMQDEIEFATELMDQKIRTLAERRIENKRKQDDNFRDNQNQRLISGEARDWLDNGEPPDQFSMGRPCFKIHKPIVCPPSKQLTSETKSPIFPRTKRTLTEDWNVCKAPSSCPHHGFWNSTNSILFTML
ncbi:reverse transcriptase domain-containing protein [Tanacetum coccineum]